ncbi:MAG: hypothetical protein ABIB93_06150 [Chloroflexota bacterium]
MLKIVGGAGKSILSPGDLFLTTLGVHLDAGDITPDLASSRSLTRPDMAMGVVMPS